MSENSRIEQLEDELRLAREKIRQLEREKVNDASKTKNC